MPRACGFGSAWGFFLHTLSNLKNAFWNVSKRFFLVNELGMVFFYAILRIPKPLSKGGRQYGVFIFGQVRLES